MMARSSFSLSLQRMWTDERIRGIFFQVLLVSAIVTLISFIIINTNNNLQQRGLDAGFGFLDDQSFFDINQRLIEYSSSIFIGYEKGFGSIFKLIKNKCFDNC